jgi:hypothetical protein
MDYQTDQANEITAALSDLQIDASQIDAVERWLETPAIKQKMLTMNMVAQLDGTGALG